jgi:hypothetical protein
MKIRRTTLAALTALVTSLVPRLALADDPAPPTSAGEPPAGPKVTSDSLAPSARSVGRQTASRSIAEVATAPAPTDSLVIFNEPEFWDNSEQEKWTLMDRSGAVICELPCSARIGPWSGYVLQGEGVHPEGKSGHLTRSRARFAVPAYIGRPPRETLVAHVKRPQQGSDGPLAFGIASGLALLGGAGLIVGTAAEGNNISLGPAIRLIGGGLALGALGLGLGLVALVWYASIEGPKLEFFHSSPPSLSSKASGARVAFSPFGVVGAF